jgi:hypothetical protein
MGGRSRRARLNEHVLALRTLVYDVGNP